MFISLWKVTGLAVAIAIMAIPGLSLAAPQGEPAADQVVRALADLDAWLGPGVRGEQWRAYLHSGRLRTLLQSGDRPNRDALIEIHGRYSSGAAGLQMRPFAAVRGALAAWLEAIPPWSVAELPQAVLSAKDDFAPSTDADVARSKQRLAAAVSVMDRALAAGGAHGAGWATYLLRDELRAQLQVDDPDIEDLNRIYDRFVGHYEGLELPWLRDVRGALRAYADRVAAAQNVEGRAAYEALIELLADTLRQHADSPTPVRMELIAYIVGQFERYDLAPEITHAIRYHYSRPNVLVHASVDVVEAGIARPVDDVTDIHDNILGTSIHGTGRTRGHVYVEMVPNPHWASLDVMLDGATESDTVGYNGPVQVYATGVTHVSGRKRLVIDETGVRGLPATAAARTSTHVHGLSTNKRGLIDRIIRRAAWKQVWQKKSQSEYIGSRHAEQRIRDRMNRESRDLIADADRDFHRKFLFPLLRHNVYPEQLQFRTTPRHLRIQSLLAGGGRLGAPSAPPVLVDDSDFAVRVHESTANNLAKDLLDGLVLTQTRVHDIAVKLRDDPTEELPDWLVVDEEHGPWSITFEAENVERATRPVTVRFADGGFRVTIHGTSYVVDGLRHDTKMDITAVYRFHDTADGWRGLREGKPLIFPPGFDPQGQRPLSVQETALKGNMEDRFDEIFQAELEIDNVTLPGDWADAGVFRLVQVESQGGWLAMAWRKADGGEGGKAATVDGSPGGADIAETGSRP